MKETQCRTYWLRVGTAILRKSKGKVVRWVSAYCYDALCMGACAVVPSVGEVKASTSAGVKDIVNGPGPCLSGAALCAQQRRPKLVRLSVRLLKICPPTGAGEAKNAPLLPASTSPYYE